MIINLDYISNIANSDLVSGIANISQFYNIYQSTKAANYAEMVSELLEINSTVLDNNSKIENKIDILIECQKEIISLLENIYKKL